MEKYLLLAIVALAITGTGLFMTEGTNNVAYTDNNTVYRKFVQWKSANNKNYNGSEEKMRFAVFSANNDYIEEWNTKGSSMVLGLNSFADLTNEEYIARFLTLQASPAKQESNEILKKPAANDSTVIDWVKNGAVSPVENQGNCGSCWAFSTAGALTGLHAVNSGNIEVFSKQQLVSCDHVDSGCRGGHFINGFNYVKNNGISLESAYPYEQFSNPNTTPCNKSKIDPVFKNKGYVSIRSGDVQGMLKGLEQQPLSIAVGASSLAFQLYQKGTIIHKGCPANLDHAILLVGVNLSASAAEDKYWVVKNSWGANWGDNGYARIQYQDGGYGVCGINKDVAYPTL